MILQAAKLALAIYETEEVYRNVAWDLGLKFHSKSVHPVHQWAAFENDTQMWVVHRGSDQLMDWLFDIFAVSEKFLSGKAHAGFLLAWNEIKQHVPKSNKEMIIVGHSKGGAIAQIQAAERVADQVITFNSPYVFDRYEARAYTPPTSLYEIYGDLGTKLPLFYTKVNDPIKLESSLPMRQRHGMTAMYEALIRNA